MKIDVYNDIVQVINSYTGSNICPNRKLDGILREKFPDVSGYTLKSIYAQEYQRKMKRCHQKFCREKEDLYNRYSDAVENGAAPGVLLKLSEEIDLSPALLARMILEQHYERCGTEGDSIATKRLITNMMKDTTLIKNKDLAYEVFMCILYDDQYGAITECIKHSFGQQYELELQRKIKELNLPFRDEEQLRIRGYDKTPDIKLEVPIAVDGFIVNWIESKALFGDEEGHKTYVREQYLSYWNRFGPGLVIYWIGFVDTLEQFADKKFIIRDTFPTNITFLDPQCIKPTIIT